MKIKNTQILMMMNNTLYVDDVEAYLYTSDEDYLDDDVDKDKNCLDTDDDEDEDY